MQLNWPDTTNLVVYLLTSGGWALCHTFYANTTKSKLWYTQSTIGCGNGGLRRFFLIYCCVPTDPIFIEDRSLNSYLASIYSRILRAAVAPSPTALAICMVAPLRTSPAAKIPGTAVDNLRSVLIKPRSSSSTPLPSRK